MAGDFAHRTECQRIHDAPGDNLILHHSLTGIFERLLSAACTESSGEGK